MWIERRASDNHKDSEQASERARADNNRKSTAINCDNSKDQAAIEVPVEEVSGIVTVTITCASGTIKLWLIWQWGCEIALAVGSLRLLSARVSPIRSNVREFFCFSAEYCHGKLVEIVASWLISWNFSSWTKNFTNCNLWRNKKDSFFSAIFTPKYEYKRRHWHDSVAFDTDTVFAWGQKINIDLSLFNHLNSHRTKLSPDVFWLCGCSEQPFGPVHRTP